MDALNYQWSFERMTQPSATEIFDQLPAQLAKLTRIVDALESQSIQNTYYQPQNSYTPNYYHSSWQNLPSFSWNNNQAQFSTPSYYHQDFQYQLPPPREISKLEALLTQVIEENALWRKSHVVIQNLQNQIGQLADVIINHPQGTLPSYSEINPKSEGKEHCEVILSSGKELLEVDGGKLKRSHPDGEEDCDKVEKKKSKVWEEEEKDEDDRALNFNCFKKNSMVPFVQQCQNYEEYNRVDFVEEYSSDEFKFGGISQFCNDAMEIKEKTKRRHAKIIFAIEPD